MKCTVWDLQKSRLLWGLRRTVRPRNCCVELSTGRWLKPLKKHGIRQEWRKWRKWKKLWRMLLLGWKKNLGTVPETCRTTISTCLSSLHKAVITVRRCHYCCQPQTAGLLDWDAGAAYSVAEDRSLCCSIGITQGTWLVYLRCSLWVDCEGVIDHPTLHC